MGPAAHSEGARRVRVLRVALSDAEQTMHERLREYAAAVWREPGGDAHAASINVGASGGAERWLSLARSRLGRV